MPVGWDIFSTPTSRWDARPTWVLVKIKAAWRSARGTAVVLGSDVEFDMTWPHDSILKRQGHESSRNTSYGSQRLRWGPRPILAVDPALAMWNWLCGIRRTLCKKIGRAHV